MKHVMLAAAMLTIGSTAAFAAEPLRKTLPLRQIVPYLETRYQGEIVAIALDAAGDKPPHYHVDLHYPGAGTSRIDIDAVTLEYTARVRPRPTRDWTSLPGATALASMHLGGEVVLAELDGTDVDTAHYDIDVRMPDGQVARIKLDPRSRAIAWRTPPILSD